MGISLTGLTPSTTYDALIKVGDNGPIDGTLKTLSDGLGNDLPMEVSTTGVNFTNNLTQGGTALQPVLVSGTNIKTINGASVLGSGDIPVVTSPSGVAGAIQFSDGSAFASDAANFFWNNTTKRLGVCTNAPGETLDVNGQIRTRATTGVNIFGAGSVGLNDAHIFLNQSQGAEISYGGNGFSAVGGYNIIGGNTTIGSTVFRNGDINLGVRLGVRGSGSTSATTSLLVQNSAGTQALKVADNLAINMGGTLDVVSNITGGGVFSGGVVYTGTNLYGQNFYLETAGALKLGALALANASAMLDIQSTTRGFLPPRMTNAQRSAISSPAVGLMVYCTDAVEGLYINKSTGWTLVI
jgi:hypothetical protein